MPARSASARRYAEAVFSIADESNTLDAWSRDLRALTDLVGDREAGALLGSNRVPRAEKMRLLTAALEGSVSPLAMNLVRLLEDRGKLALAPQIQQAFLEMADDRRGLAHAVVTTAVALSDDERLAVEQRLSQVTGKRVDVTAVVDPAIMGGLVARIGDHLIDGSTRSRLLALKRRIRTA